MHGKHFLLNDILIKKKKAKMNILLQKSLYNIIFFYLYLKQFLKSRSASIFYLLSHMWSIFSFLHFAQKESTASMGSWCAPQVCEVVGSILDQLKQMNCFCCFSDSQELLKSIGAMTGLLGIGIICQSRMTCRPAGSACRSIAKPCSSMF